MAYNLHDVKVIGIGFAEVLSCKIEGEIGEHSSLTIRGYLADNEKILYEMPAYQPIEVYLAEQEILFAGIITDISIMTSAEVQVMKVEGKSYSFLMDLIKRSRSFQDVQMSYSALVSQVMNDYPGSALFYAGPDLPIGNLIVQYEETDWEFLKRVMSMLGMSVTPDGHQKGIKLYAGIPALNEVEVWCHTIKVEKDLDTYYYLQANGHQVNDTDFTKYKISSEQLIHMFELTKICGQLFSVYSCKYEFDGQEMVGIYRLQMARGLSRPVIYPMHMIGIALNGNVVSVSGDQVQVALEIDRESGNPSVYWFVYSTISASPNGSGWYCMPEIGDDVRVYFPSKYEKEAIALSAVSNYSAPGGGQADRMQDPNSRYLRTKAGQQLALTPDHLQLSCGAGLSSVTIQGDGKIIVSAQDTVNVTAQEDLTIHAQEELTVHSKLGVLLQSLQGGKVEIGAANIKFNGTEVKFD